MMLSYAIFLLSAKLLKICRKIPKNSSKQWNGKKFEEICTMVKNRGLTYRSRDDASKS